MRCGPIFQEVVLVDEVNRMHPKTQSAFLQSMEERSVSIAGVDYVLPEHHLIIATQNPVEHGGTFALPEAQKDRFSCLVSIGYPSNERQKSILSDVSGSSPESSLASLEQAIDRETLTKMQSEVRSIAMKDRVLSGLLRFVSWTREEDSFAYGLSPRAIASFALAMRANALLSGRDFVIPEDGRDLVIPFLAHRLMARAGGPIDAVGHAMLSTRYAEFL